MSYHIAQQNDEHIFPGIGEGGAAGSEQNQYIIKKIDADNSEKSTQQEIQ